VDDLEQKVVLEELAALRALTLNNYTMLQILLGLRPQMSIDELSRLLEKDQALMIQSIQQRLRKELSSQVCRGG
jgi:hypothetical protein